MPQPRLLLPGPDLAAWRVAQEHEFAGHGEVQFVRDEDGRLVLELPAGKPSTGVVYRGPAPEGEWELTLQARRTDGSDFFCGVTFPIGAGCASWIIGGWGGGVVGLSNIDGFSAVENETTEYLEVETGRWYAIKLRVTQAKIEGWIDDKLYVDVERGEKEFKVWWEVEPMLPLGISTWNTTGQLRDVRLTELAGG